MSTLEQVVAQLQQEVFTLKALVADQTGLAEAVRAIKRQSKLKKTLRQALVARKNSLAQRRIFNSGRRKRRHFSLERLGGLR